MLLGLVPCYLQRLACQHLLRALHLQLCYQQFQQSRKHLVSCCRWLPLLLITVSTHMEASSTRKKQQRQQQLLQLHKRRQKL
jgi:hypothetical protein